MRVCLIYSGWLRTYQYCKPNHIEMLGVHDEFHINENNTDIDYHKEDIEEYNLHRIPETVVRHTMNQWRNNWLSFNKVPMMSYDILVRMRYDVELTNKIDFSTYNIEDNVVYIPEGNDYRDGCNDQLAFGNFITMQKYFSVYQHHKEIFSKGYKFHTESYLKRNLEMQGVKIIRIPTQTIIKR